MVVATIVFGASTSFWLTFAALFLTGAFDTVSMVLRHTVMQLSTPDELRGRMTSVNMIFVTGGPRLGEAEAGLVAGLAGAPFSVVAGWNRLRGGRCPDRLAFSRPETI